MAIQYQPYFRVTGSTNWIPFGPAIGAPPVTITGLSPLVAYDFQIVASNSFALAVSSPVTAATTSASGVPPSGSVGGAQTTGTTNPVLAGPTSGTVLKSGTLPITGITIVDTASSGATTWSATDKSAGYALSNASLTATSGAADAGTNGEGIRSTTSKNAGKTYFEIQIGGTLGGNLSIGIANSTFVIASGGGMGGDADSAGYYTQAGGATPQSLYINNGILTSGLVGIGSDAVGAWISFAIDIGSKLIWITSPAMRTQSGASAWNNSATASPGSGTGGLSLATLNAGPYFITTNNTAAAAVTTINVGGSAFSVAVPSGFSSWDGPNTATGTLTLTTTGGTLTTNIGAANLPGSGTGTITYTSTLANVQIAIANLTLTAPSVVTSVNVKAVYVNAAAATNSLTIPVSVITATAPSAPAGLTVR